MLPRTTTHRSNWRRSGGRRDAVQQALRLRSRARQPQEPPTGAAPQASGISHIGVQPRYPQELAAALGHPRPDPPLQSRDAALSTPV